MLSPGGKNVELIIEAYMTEFRFLKWTYSRLRRKGE